MPAHPIPHPLSTMSSVTDKRMPYLPGTLAIAERIGATHILNTGSLPAENAGNEVLQIILPFFSDILWAVRETDGTVKKCLNWNIKDEEASFSRPFQQKQHRNTKTEDVENTIARHTLERLYHLEADIKTVQLGLDQLDERLQENLKVLFGHHRRKVDLDDQLQVELKERFVTALQTETPPLEVILGVMRRHQFSIDGARTLLWQLIWRRELRVDLFSTLLIDRPLKPEIVDPVMKYADWFRG